MSSGGGVFLTGGETAAQSAHRMWRIEQQRRARFDRFAMGVAVGWLGCLVVVLATWTVLGVG